MPSPTYSQPPTIKAKIDRIYEYLPRGFSADYFKGDGFEIYGRGQNPEEIKANGGIFVTKSFAEAIAYARGLRAGYDLAERRKS